MKQFIRLSFRITPMPQWICLKLLGVTGLNSENNTLTVTGTKSKYKFLHFFVTLCLWFCNRYAMRWSIIIMLLSNVFFLSDVLDKPGLGEVTHHRSHLHCRCHHRLHHRHLHSRCHHRHLHHHLRHQQHHHFPCPFRWMWLYQTGKPKNWDEPTIPPSLTLTMKSEGFHIIYCVFHQSCSTFPLPGLCSVHCALCARLIFPGCFQGWSNLGWQTQQ